MFVLMIYWVNFRQIYSCVQMERWDVTVYDINAICSKRGPKCLQLLGMHNLTGSDTTSYIFGIWKVSALKTLMAGNFQELSFILGELNASNDELFAAGSKFVNALYGLPEGTPQSERRHQFYTCKSGKPLKLMVLPPTEANLLYHILRAYLQIILRKAAGQTSPPNVIYSTLWLGIERWYP